MGFLGDGAEHRWGGHCPCIDVPAGHVMGPAQMVSLLIVKSLLRCASIHIGNLSRSTGMSKSSCNFTSYEQLHGFRGQFYLFIYFSMFYWLLLQFSQFSPFISPLPCTSQPLRHPHLSSCPWVVHISSWTSLFPVLFPTSPCLFCTYHLCCLFPVPFPPILPLPLPTEKPLCGVHFSGSVPVLVVCLVFVFLFVFMFICW